MTLTLAIILTVILLLIGAPIFIIICIRSIWLIKVDEHLMTSHQGIFAAGDVVRGGSTVVQSIADGKCAGVEIDKFLKGG